MRSVGRSTMTKKFPINPSNPERICWGCDKYCPADSLACGNGSDRTPHLAELFGPDWAEWAPHPADGALPPLVVVESATPTDEAGAAAGKP
jgi:hypothetical protein